MRTKRIVVRLTVEEWQELNLRAHAALTSMEGYVRNKLKLHKKEVKKA